MPKKTTNKRLKGSHFSMCSDQKEWFCHNFSHWLRVLFWQQSHLLVLLFCSCLLLPAFAFAAVPQPKQLLQQQQSQQQELPAYCTHDNQGSLARHVSFIRDPEQQLTIDTLLQYPERFVPINSDLINFGANKDQFWLRFTVENCTTESQDLLYILNFSRAGNMDIYRGDLDWENASLNNRTQIFRNKQSYQEIIRQYKTLTFPFHLQAGERQTFIMRYIPTNDSIMPLEVKERAQQGFDLIKKHSMVTAISSAFFALILFNACLFAFTQMKIFFIHVVIEVSCILYFLHNLGYTTAYLWGDVSWDLAVAGSLGSFTVAMTLLFNQKYFDLRHQAPRLNRLMQILFWSCLCFSVTKVITYLYTDWPSTQVNSFGYVAFFASVTTSIATAFYFTLIRSADDRERMPNLLILFAWIVLTFNMLAISLRPLDLFPYHAYNNIYFGFALIVEAVLITLALSLRIRNISIDREQKLLEVTRLQEDKINQQAREQALILQKAVSDQAATETGRLILTVGHDSRQIIAALGNYAHVLTGLFKQDERVNKIAASIRQASELLNDIFGSAMDLGENRSVEKAPQFTEFDTQRLFTPLEMIYKQAAQAKGNRIRFRQGQCELCSDHVLLLRILGNFISNAINATRDGTIYVGWRQREDYLIFEVRDSGTGISQEKLAALLQGPVTLDADTLPSESNSLGIGLKASAAIAERLGGALSLRSKPGYGTTAQLLIPLRNQSADMTERLETVS